VPRDALTSRELGEKLGLSSVRIRELARASRVTHASKPAGRWQFSPDSRVIPLNGGSFDAALNAGDYDLALVSFRHLVRRVGL
jgi:hypothetical protein